MRQPYNAAQFPRPGQPNFDDNNDHYAGVSDVGDLGSYYNNTFGSSLFSAIPPFLQPLDYYGAGAWLTIPSVGTNGLIANLIGVNPTVIGEASPAYLRYTGYQPQFNASPPPQFGANQTALFYDTTGLYHDVAIGGQWVSGYQAAMQTNWLSVSPYNMFPNYPGNVDEGYEVVGDIRYQQSSDQIFSRDETAALQLADSDFAKILGQSRVKALASFNFDLNQQAATIRKRFTTESADRKNNGWAYNNLRSWEYGVTPAGASTTANNNDWDGSGASSGALQFPPRVLTTSLVNAPPNTTNSYSGNGPAEPIRLEVAAAIGARVHNGQVNFNNAFNTPALQPDDVQRGHEPVAAAIAAQHQPFHGGG